MIFLDPLLLEVLAEARIPAELLDSESLEVGLIEGQQGLGHEGLRVVTLGFKDEDQLVALLLEVPEPPLEHPPLPEPPDSPLLLPTKLPVSACPPAEQGVAPLDVPRALEVQDPELPLLDDTVPF